MKNCRANGPISGGSCVACFVWKITCSTKIGTLSIFLTFPGKIITKYFLHFFPLNLTSLEFISHNFLILSVHHSLVQTLTVRLFHCSEIANCDFRNNINLASKVSKNISNVEVTAMKKSYLKSFDKHCDFRIFNCWQKCLAETILFQKVWWTSWLSDSLMNGKKC